MEDDDSNDVMIVENTEETPMSLSELQKTETRPIMLLFERLITNDSKKNTILTNVQIYAILQKEFNMNVTAFHPLEVTIYLNIVKRFLKDWPQWDEFDNMINRLKKVNATSSIKNILEHKYKNLKEYLRETIEITKPLAKKAVDDLPKEQQAVILPSFDTSDIVLEIYSTRKQLNEFVLNRPLMQYNKTIFNFPGEDDSRQKINTQEFPIEAILNYPDIKFTIDLKFFNYHRSTRHDLKHCLINAKLNVPEEKVVLKTDIQRKTSVGTVFQWNKSLVTTLVLNSILQGLTDEERRKVECIINVIKSDFDCMAHDEIKIPGHYRQYMNEYPYYRKLFKPVNMEPNRDYDLFIKEMISPMYLFYIGKISPVETNSIPKNFSWIKIECLICKITFTKENFHDDLVEHFKQCHVDEPDWTCSNCKKSFNMIHLSYRKWEHVCDLDIE